MVFPKGVGILWKYHPNSKWRKSWHFFVLKPSPRSISDKNCHHISTTVSNTLKTLQTTTGNETNTFKNNETKEMNGPRRPRKSYHPLRSRWTETPNPLWGPLETHSLTLQRCHHLRSVGIPSIRRFWLEKKTGNQSPSTGDEFGWLLFRNFWEKTIITGSLGWIYDRCNHVDICTGMSCRYLGSLD